MQKRIFYSIFSACVLLLVLINLFLLFTLETFFQKKLFYELESSVNQAVSHVKKYINGEEKYYNNHRLTIIQKDGKVLYDNFADIHTMDNHLYRVEVQGAIKDGRATSIRYSDTLHKKTLYYAALLQDGTIIRLSNTQEYIIGSLIELIPYFVFEFIVFCIMSFVFAIYLSKIILRPIVEFDLDSLSEDSLYKELHSFVKKIKIQNKTIKQKQQEMLLLIENMNDGIILLNRHGNIVNTNKSANNYIENIEINFSIYQISDSAFLKIVLECLEEFKKNKKRESKIFHLKLMSYECEVVLSSIISKNKFRGMVIVIRNITEKKMMHNLRREFSANVTHELKTPLTSILASSEMIKNNLVAREDLDSFVDRIYFESRRLLSMIDEILKISFFDEGREEHLKKTRVNLRAIINNVIDRLKLIASRSEVDIKVDLIDCYIYGVSDLLEDSIFNLCDNAIRYNKKDGKVFISLKRHDKKIILEIEDTGIGIPDDSLPRIFERFFCVDKGRSKKLGGSGLGLSIVQSAMRYHNAEIKVESKLGIGSTFIVIFDEVI